MFRVTLPVLAAVATLASVGTANAQCCGASGGLFTSGYSWNAGWGTGCGGCGTSFVATPVVVQAAPVVVQAQPIVVQQPVLVQQPVVVQQQPVVQQYVVNQGPVYSGPAITKLNSYYYPPRAVRSYPYVGARWGGYYRRAAWNGPRYGHYHRYHGPIRRYY